MIDTYNDVKFMNAIGLTRLPEIGHVADAIELVQLPVVRPTPNEVAIRLRASSMHIDEVYAAQGTALGRFYGPKAASAEKPYVLGSSVSGIVVGLGENVVQFSLGDEVIVIPDHQMECGSWSEFRCVAQQRVMLKPEKLSHVEAAATTMAACVAWGAIRSSQAQVGSRCVVVGASGSIGVMVLQYLHQLGCEVTAVCSHRNAEFVLSKGASHVVDYTLQNFAYEAHRTGLCYDCVFDCVGGREVERDGFRVLKRSGTYVTVVGPMQYIGERKLSWYELFKVVGHVVRRILLTRLSGPRYAFGATRPSSSIEAALSTAVNCNLQMPIERTIPFQIEAIRDAIRLLTTHRAKGRIVIDFEMSS